MVIVNLAFHATNGLLVFLLFKKITKRNDLALSAAGLFLINSRSYQVVAWIPAGLEILSIAFLILLSLIFFVDYLEKKKLIYFLYSILFLSLSLLFKEIFLFLFIFYTLSLIFYNLNRKKIRTAIKPLLLLAGTAGLYFFIRLVVSPISSALPLATYAFRVLAVPLKGISQAFFPEKLLIKIADMITTVAYPNFSSARDGVNPYISRVIVFDLLTYLLTIAILIFSFGLFFFLRKQEYKRLSRIIFFSLLFIITSLLPFIFIPGDSGYFSIFEPKNLYFATIGASLIIVIFVFSIANIFQRWKIQKKLFFGILAIIFLINIL